MRYDYSNTGFVESVREYVEEFGGKKERVWDLLENTMRRKFDLYHRAYRGTSREGVDYYFTGAVFVIRYRWRLRRIDNILVVTPLKIAVATEAETREWQDRLI